MLVYRLVASKILDGGLFRQVRDKELFEERERCRVLENALQVLATEHEAVLNSMEHAAASGTLSSAGSVYFSPPESIADLEDNASMDVDDYKSVASTEEDFRDADYDDETSRFHRHLEKQFSAHFKVRHKAMTATTKFLNLIRNAPSTCWPQISEDV